MGMSGSMDFREALRLRLDVIQPHLTQIDEMNLKNPPVITPNVEYVHVNRIEII